MRELLAAINAFEAFTKKNALPDVGTSKTRSMPAIRLERGAVQIKLWTIHSEMWIPFRGALPHLPPTQVIGIPKALRRLRSAATAQKERNAALNKAQISAAAEIVADLEIE